MFAENMVIRSVANLDSLYFFKVCNINISYIVHFFVFYVLQEILGSKELAEKVSYLNLVNRKSNISICHEQQQVVPIIKLQTWQKE